MSNGHHHLPADGNAAARTLRGSTMQRLNMVASSLESSTSPPQQSLPTPPEQKQAAAGAARNTKSEAHSSHDQPDNLEKVGE